MCHEARQSGQTTIVTTTSSPAGQLMAMSHVYKMPERVPKAAPTATLLR